MIGILGCIEFTPGYWKVIRTTNAKLDSEQLALRTDVRVYCDPETRDELELLSAKMIYASESDRSEKAARAECSR